MKKFFPTLGMAKTFEFKKFIKTMAASWVAVNASVILLFACVYYTIDKHRENSYFTGISKNREDRLFSDYLYFSVIISSTLGLGEIAPRRPEENTEFSIVGRVVIATHILFSLFVNDVLDSIENFVLA